MSRINKLKRSGYKNAIGGLFLAIPPKTIVQRWIVQPILFMFSALAKWAAQTDLKEGEEAVHFIRYKDGKAIIYVAAMSANGPRIIRGYDPEAMLLNFANDLDETQLKNSMALALVPYAEGEEPDAADDDDDSGLMERLFASAPPLDDEETLLLPETSTNPESAK